MSWALALAAEIHLINPPGQGLSSGVSANQRLPWVDAVEKGKNDLTENFPCEPVETSIRECSGS